MTPTPAQLMPICPVCQGSDFEIFPDEDSIIVLDCRGCGLVYFTGCEPDHFGTAEGEDEYGLLPEERNAAIKSMMDAISRPTPIPPVTAGEGEFEPYDRNKITNDMDALRSKIEYLQPCSVRFLSQHTEDILNFLAQMREPWLAVWDERDNLKKQLEEKEHKSFHEGYESGRIETLAAQRALNSIPQPPSVGNCLKHGSWDIEESLGCPVCMNEKIQLPSVEKRCTQCGRIGKPGDWSECFTVCDICWPVEKKPSGEMLTIFHAEHCQDNFEKTCSCGANEKLTKAQIVDLNHELITYTESEHHAELNALCNMALQALARDGGKG